MLSVNPNNTTAETTNHWVWAIKTTHVMLIDDAMVYPMATPKRFKYWTEPHILTSNRPEK